MSRARRGTKGAARRVSWPAAVVALPVALVVWVALIVGLTIALADFVLGGFIALGVLAVAGCVLLLSPGERARGAGLGTLVTLIPCALVLALSVV